MTNNIIEFLNQPITVTATIDRDGLLIPKCFVWRNRQYKVVGIGHRWQVEGEYFILTETMDGTRFEMQLSSQDLTWRLRKIWWNHSLV